MRNESKSASSLTTDALRLPSQHVTTPSSVNRNDTPQSPLLSNNAPCRKEKLKLTECNLFSDRVVEESLVLQDAKAHTPSSHQPHHACLSTLTSTANSQWHTLNLVSGMSDLFEGPPPNHGLQATRHPRHGINNRRAHVVLQVTANCSMLKMFFDEHVSFSAAVVSPVTP